MSSKGDEVHKKRTELQWKIVARKAEEKLVTNNRQIEIKRRKIWDWEKEIEDLAESLPVLRKPKKKKWRVYIEDSE